MKLSMGAMKSEKDVLSSIYIVSLCVENGGKSIVFIRFFQNNKVPNTSIIALSKSERGIAISYRHALRKSMTDPDNVVGFRVNSFIVLVSVVE